MARNVTSKFGVADGLDFSSEQGVTSIAIDKLVPYRNHRFTLYKGERLEDMIQSIKKNGVITPIIVKTEFIIFPFITCIPFVNNDLSVQKIIKNYPCNGFCF